MVEIGQQIRERFRSELAEYTGSVLRVLVITIAIGGLSSCVRATYVSPSSPLGIGIAHLENGQLEAAREQFAAWLENYPEDPRALMGVAVILDEQGFTDSAFAIYNELNALRLPGEVRRELKSRILISSRKLMADRARQLVASEARLAQTAPEPNSVAILPFQYLGANPDLEPLGRGVAHLLVSDLQRLAVMKVLERLQIQLIVDEIRLSETDRVDQRTAVRSGRLLSAQNVIHGSILDGDGEGSVRMDAEMVNTSTSEVESRGSRQDQLREFFRLEKDVLRQLLENFGIQLSAAELEILADQPTNSILAYLAFSRGLAASDRGDFALASQEFATALAIDPDFQEAAVLEEESSEASQSESASSGEMTRMLGLIPFTNPLLLADDLNRVMPSGIQLGDQVAVPTGSNPPPGRDQGGDVAGEDRIARSGTVIIRVERP